MDIGNVKKSSIRDEDRWMTVDGKGKLMEIGEKRPLTEEEKKEMLKVKTRKYKEPTSMKVPFKDRMEERRIEKLVKLKEKQAILQSKLKTKAETHRLKAETSELKQKQRRIRGERLRGVGGLIQTKPTKKEHVYIHEPGRERLERDRLNREKEIYKREQEYKYKQRHSDDGELPHYTPEHMKKLPKRTSPKHVKQIKVKSIRLI
jgi:hypothetical protein